MRLFARKNWYNYIEDVPESMLKKVTMTIEETANRLDIRDFINGEYIATRVHEIVEEVLRTNTLPKGFGSIKELSVGLGALYGHAICVGKKWKWKRIGDNGRTASFGIVSPKQNYSLEPEKYILHILNSETMGSETNNLLMLYQKIDQMDKKPKKEKYYPIM